MKINVKNIVRTFIYIMITTPILLSSCEPFFEPEQGLIVDEDKYFKDWNEYRAAELGLYALQQDLVTQLVVLGELRADLINVTENADRDLKEIATFQVTPGNKYASPINFYKLIGACNRLATQLETNHPEVLKDTAVNIYDRLYGEVLCMRAWAYFNAVRIFKEVPYIWPSLNTVDDIDEYVSGNMTVIRPMHIEFAPDGYANDTIYGDSVVLDRIYLDLPAIIDTFSIQLTEKLKAVGVIHNLINDDLSWDVSIWNHFAKECLLGHMYLEIGDYVKAEDHFAQILYFQRINENIGSNLRYGLDNKFSNANWRTIFTGIDSDEHIYTLWFNKSNQQQNDLQFLFSKDFPNLYMLKPTPSAVQMWESQWKGFRLEEDENNPDLTILDPLRVGTPGDFQRGYNVSYIFQKNGRIMTPNEVKSVLELKRKRNELAVKERMEGVDTIVYKYTIGKNSFDHDANFPIYRAGGIHLYYAEIYARWRFPDASGNVKPNVNKGLAVLNSGNYDNDGNQLGVRGRVGFGTGNQAISTTPPIYQHDPITNEVTGYFDFTGDLPAIQIYVEDQIQNERARELAFEGERFYDLMRIARRRDDPAYLANKVAAKFPHPMREEIREHLMDEENWYLKLQ